jgi:O-acetylserine/cysteine efflux transporter
MSAASADAEGTAPIAGQDLALMLFINLIWGLNLVASKWGVNAFPPIFFTALRFGAVALLLLPLLRIPRGQLRTVLTAAVLTGPMAFGLLFIGVDLVSDASMVAIASQLSVPISTLLSVWLLGERIRWRRWLGIGLAFFGIVVIGLDPRAFTYWEGLLLVALSCIANSFGLIFIKRLQGIRALQLQAWVAVVGAPLLFALSFASESGQVQAMIDADTRAWAALAFTAVFSSLIAHTGWYYLLSRYPVTSLSPLTLLSPVFGVFFGVTLLHDQLTWRMGLGGAMTLVGVFIVLLRERKLVDTGT